MIRTNQALLLSLVAAFFISCESPVDAKVYDFRFCATTTEFEGILESHCGQVLERRTQPDYDVVRSAKQANKFLGRVLTLNAPARLESERTSHREECCNEGCRVEEIYEYCHIGM